MQPGCSALLNSGVGPRVPSPLPRITLAIIAVINVGGSIAAATNATVAKATTGLPSRLPLRT